MEKNLNTFTRKGNQLIHTRLLKAPRELVWEVWTTPEHVKEWWGPMGFSVTNDSMEVKPGGVWKFTMHGMGQNFPNIIKFERVEKPSLLSFRNGGADDKYSYEGIVTFEERGSNTLLIFKSIFPSTEILDELNRTVNAIEGGKQTLNRLESYLNNQLQNK